MTVTNFTRWFTCLTLLAGCAADTRTNNTADGDTPSSSESALVGSYELPSGGELAIYELASGDFVIGEHVPAGVPSPEVISDADLDSESLPAIYSRYVGNDVPQELVLAEKRRLAAIAREQERPASIRVRAPLEQTVPEIYQQPEGSFQSKEVDHAVAWFQACHCRGLSTWEAKNFNICLTERTGNGTVSKLDAHGSYSAVYVFHGSLDYSVRYNITGWQTAFNVTVSEGSSFRARKVGPVRDYDVEARVTNAVGDGFNIALIGTTNRGSKGCYSDWASIACSVVANCP